MIKTIVAYTYEMLDTNIAITEILQQLDLKKTLLTNTAGIITCFPIHIEIGIIKALSEALPFDIVGSVTLGNAVKDKYGAIMPMLTLTMLTSDEITFATACTSTLENLEARQILDIAPINAAQGNKKPSMVMPFIPLCDDIDPTIVLNCLQKDISGNVPLFGMVSCEPMGGTTSAVIYHGQAINNAISLLLIYGNIKPTFFVASISDENIHKQHAIITKSAGHILQEVNDMPVIQYMATLGLDLSQHDALLASLNVIPFVINYNNGTQPVLRVMKQVSPEGYAVCAGDMPMHATLSIASFEAEEILGAVEHLANQIKATAKTNGLLIISCVARNFVLGNDNTLEMAKLYNILGDSVPYVGCYSGGEICPLYDQEGKTINSFNNCSIIACVF